MANDCFVIYPFKLKKKKIVQKALFVDPMLSNRIIKL